MADPDNSKAAGAPPGVSLGQAVVRATLGRVTELERARATDASTRLTDPPPTRQKKKTKLDKLVDFLGGGNKAPDNKANRDSASRDQVDKLNQGAGSHSAPGQHTGDIPPVPWKAGDKL